MRACTLANKRAPMYQSSAELDPSITGTVLQQYIGGYANTYPFSLQGGLVGVSPAQPLVVNAYANYENAQVAYTV
eukprot:1296328-Amorphochlora_amoeboformis.AAC.1